MSENRSDNAFYAYSYSGRLSQRRESDHSPIPAFEEDSITVQGFRKVDDTLLKEDLDFRVGEAFKIRLTPFSFDPADTSFELPGNLSDFENPALPVLVEIFQDSTPGERVEEWLMAKRQLSFPVLISRK